MGDFQNLEQCEQQLDRLFQASQDCVRQIHGQQDELKARDAEVERLQSQVQLLQREIDGLMRQCDTEAAKREAIENSKSWRATEPLRKVSRFIHGSSRPNAVEHVREMPADALRVDDDADAEAGRLSSFSDLEMFCQDKGIECFGADVLQEFDQGHDKIFLLVSHELDNSGAPIALLTVAEVLMGEGYRVVIASARNGELLGDCLRRGIPVLVDSTLGGTAEFIAEYGRLFDVAVVNTIVMAPAIQPLADTDVPVLWWIHEANLVYEAPTLVENLPVFLPANVRVFVPGPHARRALQAHRPLYKADTLWFCVSDEAGECQGGEAIVCCSSGRMRFGIVGSIEPRKGQVAMCDAIRELPADVLERCHFSFVGRTCDESVREEIARLAGEYPESVSLVGALERNRMAGFYDSLDCLICPSHDDPGPTVVAEAMSHGCPIICSDNAGIFSIVEEAQCGVVYHDGETGALAGAIRRARDAGDEQLAAWGNNGMAAYREYFSMEVFARNVLGALDEVMGT